MKNKINRGLRRLQQIKGGSYTTSLPKDWVEQQGLKGGDLLDVHKCLDGALRLYPSSVDNSQKITLNLEEFRRTKDLGYSIRTYYMQGCDIIYLKSKKIIPEDVKTHIRLLRMELPGFDIIKESAYSLDFQVMIDKKTYTIDSLVSTTSEFADRLHRDAIKSLINCHTGLAEDVVGRVSEALRQYALSVRLISQATQDTPYASAIGSMDCREAVTYVLFSRDIQRIIYHSSSIANQVITFGQSNIIKKNLADTIKWISTKVLEMQNSASKAFLNKDVELALNAIQLMSEVSAKDKMFRSNLLVEKNIRLVIGLSKVADDLRRIAGYSVAMADDAMNRILVPGKSKS